MIKPGLQHDVALLPFLLDLNLPPHSQNGPINDSA